MAARQEVPRGGEARRPRADLSARTRPPRSPRRPRSSTSTRRSRPTSASASTPATPTRWSAARSSCRTAPARSSGSPSSPRATRPRRRSAPAPTRSAARTSSRRSRPAGSSSTSPSRPPTRWAMVGRLGKILGRRGLMPNPKAGTITFDLDRAIREVKGGRVEFKVDKAGIIHAAFGKVELRGRRARRQPRGPGRRDQPGQAGRRQGPVPEGPDDRQHDGPGHPGRHPGAPRRRRRGLSAASPARGDRPRPRGDGRRRVATTEDRRTARDSLRPRTATLSRSVTVGA